MKKLILVLLTSAISLNLSSQGYLDSLHNIWNDTTQSDSVRLDALHAFAWDGYLFSFPDSAFYYAQLEYDLAEASNNMVMMSRALNTQAISWHVRGDYDKALEFLFKSMEIKEEIGDNLGIAGAQNNIGRIYERQGDFVKALEYYNMSLKIKEEMGDQRLISNTLINIGSVFFAQGDPDEALEYYNNALKIKEELGNPNDIALVLIHIGTVYGEQGDTDKAIELFNRSLKIKEEVGDLQSVAGLQHNLGLIFAEQGEKDKALEYYRNSLVIRKQINDKGGVAESLSVLALFHQSQGNFKQAIDYGNQAFKLAEEIGDIEYSKDISWDLYGSYKAVGKYQKALEMHELAISLRDSILSEQNQRAAIEQEYRYDYEKQKALDDLENEKRVAMETQKKENQQKLSLAIGIGLLLALIMAWGIFNRLKVTRQQKLIIEEQKKKVEQSEKYKEQFLANMSHEIRTPMHAISGMVNILQRNDHPPSQEVYLDAMSKSADNLVVILNDVLDLSKIEAGKLDIESIPMNPRSVIDNVLQILKFRAEEKGLTMSAKVDDDVPQHVMGDPARLNQILINLVGNAIKFTEKGSVSINLEKAADNLVFKVVDTGIGIPKEKQEHIFGAFEQATESTSRHYGGTGLGLNITRQLVQLQKGSVLVNSEEGKGSTFSVSLPLVKAKAEAKGSEMLTEERLKSMQAALKGIRILLAEDNPFNQMIAQDDLEYYIEGVTIDIASNGQQAIEKYKHEHYDIILMDVQMPEVNGFEATRSIRSIETEENSKKPIPIIAMTASLLVTEINNCFDAGMNNYIPKPYKVNELIGTIFYEHQKGV